MTAYKWVTDVTKFSVDGKKLYLSPLMDLFNGEIVAYATSTRPLLNMVGTMLSKAFARLGPNDRPILHSDQGRQYRIEKYRRRLDTNAVTQSMSPKRKLPGQCGDGELLRNAEIRVLRPQQV